jgi:hypothetical protein
MLLQLPNRKKVSFFANIALDEATGCWNWTGNLRNWRYGGIYYSGRDESVHRVVAHLYLGFDLASPLEVCHRCDNPRCFNPKHLFVGTHLENMQDMVKKGRSNYPDACGKGHPFSLENTYVHERDGSVRRGCRSCNKEANRQYRQRKSSQEAPGRIV